MSKVLFLTRKVPEGIIMYIVVNYSSFLLLIFPNILSYLTAEFCNSVRWRLYLKNSGNRKAECMAVVYIVFVYITKYNTQT